MEIAVTKIMYLQIFRVSFLPNNRQFSKSELKFVQHKNSSECCLCVCRYSSFMRLYVLDISNELCICVHVKVLRIFKVENCLPRACLYNYLYL
jgi:hypothetical protein